jgi:hypothetical protein
MGPGAGRLRRHGLAFVSAGARDQYGVSPSIVVR